jgi:hypothetical protein
MPSILSLGLLGLASRRKLVDTRLNRRESRHHLLL